MDKRLCIAVLLLQLGSSSSAQEPSTEPEEPSSSELEEIVVRGERSLGVLRDQIRQAEVAIYDLFNQINTDDRFDIHCRMEPSTGTRMLRHVCLPNYYHEATASEGVAMLRDMQDAQNGSPLSGGRLDPPAAALIARNERILQEKMREAIVANPELLETIIKLHELNTEYEATRKGRAPERE